MAVNRANKLLLVGNSIIIIALTSWAFTRSPEDGFLKSHFIPARTTHFELQRYFHEPVKAVDSNNFPVKAFLDSSDFSNAHTVQQYLFFLDSICAAKEANREFLSNMLTRQLFDRYYGGDISSLDSLLGILRWAQQFSFVNASREEDKFFYQSLSDYWINLVAENLSRLSETKPDLRYTFPFRYLVARCGELNYFIPIQVLGYEKFSTNLMASNWGHLISATYFQSSFFQKTIFVVLTLIFLYGLYKLFIKLLNLGKRLLS